MEGEIEPAYSIRCHPVHSANPQVADSLSVRDGAMVGRALRLWICRSIWSSGLLRLSPNLMLIELVSHGLGRRERRRPATAARSYECLSVAPSPRMAHAYRYAGWALIR